MSWHRSGQPSRSPPSQCSAHVRAAGLGSHSQHWTRWPRGSSAVTTRHARAAPQPRACTRWPRASCPSPAGSRAGRGDRPMSSIVLTPIVAADDAIELGNKLWVKKLLPVGRSATRAGSCPARPSTSPSLPGLFQPGPTIRSRSSSLTPPPRSSCTRRSARPSSGRTSRARTIAAGPR